MGDELDHIGEICMGELGDERGNDDRVISLIGAHVALSGDAGVTLRELPECMIYPQVLEQGSDRMASEIGGLYARSGREEVAQYIWLRLPDPDIDLAIGIMQRAMLKRCFADTVLDLRVNPKIREGGWESYAIYRAVMGIQRDRRAAEQVNSYSLPTRVTIEARESMYSSGCASWFTWLQGLSRELIYSLLDGNEFAEAMNQHQWSADGYFRPTASVVEACRVSRSRRPILETVVDPFLLHGIGKYNRGELCGKHGDRWESLFTALGERALIERGFWGRWRR